MEERLRKILNNAGLKNADDIAVFCHGNTKNLMKIKGIGEKGRLKINEEIIRQTGESLDDWPNNFIWTVMPNIFHFPLAEDQKKMLDEMLSTLTEREELFLRECFQEHMNFYEMAEKWIESTENHISQEHVFGITAKAVRKMKHPKRVRKILHAAEILNDEKRIKKNKNEMRRQKRNKKNMRRKKNG